MMIPITIRYDEAKQLILYVFQFTLLFQLKLPTLIILGAQNIILPVYCYDYIHEVCNLKYRIKIKVDIQTKIFLWTSRTIAFNQNLFLNHQNPLSLLIFYFEENKYFYQYCQVVRNGLNPAGHNLFKAIFTFIT